jgi:hypothetical protein
MKEKVFEMMRKIAVVEDFSDKEILDELGMEIDEYRAAADNLYNTLSENDKGWVDASMEEWYKEYSTFFGNEACSQGNCCSCSGQHH